MKTRFLLIVVTTLVSLYAKAEENNPATTSDAQLEKQIAGIVKQLSGAKSADRDAAEKQLLELAGTTAAQTDRFLALLPKDNDQMPLALRDRLSRIRRQIEERTAKVATNGTKVT